MPPGDRLPTLLLLLALAGGVAARQDKRSLRVLACTLSNCATCTPSGTACTACKAGYYVKLGRCSTCSSALPNCTACKQSGTACTACKAGFFVRNGRCAPCSAAMPNCTACNAAGNACSACSQGFYVNGAKRCANCSAAISKCLTCTNSTTCTRCSSGYFINSTARCAACSSKIPGCATCDRSGATCSQCSSGTTGSQAITGGGGYLACSRPCNVAGCVTCVSGDPNTCAACNEGWSPGTNSKQCKQPDCLWSLNTTSTLLPGAAPGLTASSAGCSLAFADVSLTLDQPFTRATGCAPFTRGSVVRDSAGLRLAFGGACSTQAANLPAGWRLTAPANATLVVRSVVVGGWSADAVPPFIVRFTDPGGAQTDVVVPKGAAKGKYWQVPGTGFSVPAATPSGYTAALVAAPGQPQPASAWVALRVVAGDVRRPPSTECGPTESGVWLDASPAFNMGPRVISMAQCCAACGASLDCGAFTFVGFKNKPSGVCYFWAPSPVYVRSSDPSQFDPGAFLPPMSVTIAGSSALVTSDAKVGEGADLYLTCPSGTVQRISDAVFGSFDADDCSVDISSPLTALCAGKALSKCGPIACSSASFGSPCAGTKECIVTFDCK